MTRAALQTETPNYRWPLAGSETLRSGALSLETEPEIIRYGRSGCGKPTLLAAIAGVVDIPCGADVLTGQDPGRIVAGALADLLLIDGNSLKGTYARKYHEPVLDLTMKGRTVNENDP